MVLADSHRISRVPRYSGYCYKLLIIRVQDYHLLWLNFPEYSTSFNNLISQSYNPKYAWTYLVWANSISIASTLEITFVFFSSGYLDVSVLRVCLPNKSEWYCFTVPGCPIRISTDRQLFAPPRSFSQLITSFFASESLGIHHTPLVTFFHLFSGAFLLFYLSFQYVNELVLPISRLLTITTESNRHIF